MPRTEVSSVDKDATESITTTASDNPLDHATTTASDAPLLTQEKIEALAEYIAEHGTILRKGRECNYCYLMMQSNSLDHEVPRFPGCIVMWSPRCETYMCVNAVAAKFQTEWEEAVGPPSKNEVFRTSCLGLGDNVVANFSAAVSPALRVQDGEEPLSPLHLNPHSLAMLLKITTMRESPKSL